MEPDYQRHVDRPNPAEPPEGLLAMVMARIYEEERMLSVRKRLVLFSMTALMSVAALVPVAGAFRSEFAGSGFYQYFSLIFSDLDIVMVNWRDFGLTLLESLPTTGIISLLLVSLVFFWSLKHLARAWSVVTSRTQLINS